MKIVTILLNLIVGNIIVYILRCDTSDYGVLMAGLSVACILWHWMLFTVNLPRNNVKLALISIASCFGIMLTGLILSAIIVGFNDPDPGWNIMLSIYSGLLLGLLASVPLSPLLIAWGALNSLLLQKARRG